MAKESNVTPDKKESQTSEKTTISAERTLDSFAADEEKEETEKSRRRRGWFTTSADEPEKKKSSTGSTAAAKKALGSTWSSVTDKISARKKDSPEKDTSPRQGAKDPAESKPTQNKKTPGSRQSATEKKTLSFPKANDKTTTASTASSATSNVVAFPETEQERKKKRKRIGLGIGLGILGLVIVVLLVVYFSPLLAIRTIVITGPELMPQHKAEELLEPLKGRPLPQVGESQAEELVGSDPAVASVSTRAEPPNTLVIEIIEYTPVAMAPQGDAFTMFNDKGEPIATITAQQAQDYDLPVVSSAEDVADPALFNAISEVLGSLPEEMRAQVSTASAATLDSITLELNSGKTVLWGNTSQPEQKLAVLQALLTLPEEEAAQISAYDVSTPDHPVTR